MSNELPRIRSDVLSALDQVKELLDRERGKRPSASEGLIYALDQASRKLEGVLALFDPWE